MKLKMLFVACCAMTLLNTGCKKSGITIDQPINNVDDAVQPSYIRLLVGQQWIYQGFNIDKDGIATATSIYDSVWVDKDTTIRGSKYYKVMKPATLGGKDYMPSYQRDSSGYLVDSKGTILFAENDFKTTFSSRYFMSSNISPVDSVGLVETRMSDRDVMKAVPLGNFYTSSMTTTWTMHPYFEKYAPRVRKLYSRYAAGMGMVSETLPFYAIDATYQERRLIRAR